MLRHQIIAILASISFLISSCSGSAFSFLKDVATDVVSPGDRDNDGKLDLEDRCPDVGFASKETIGKDGCPAADSDKDGVVDGDDLCNDTPPGETPDLNDGCIYYQFRGFYEITVSLGDYHQVVPHEAFYSPPEAPAREAWRVIEEQNEKYCESFRAQGGGASCTIVSTFEVVWNKPAPPCIGSACDKGRPKNEDGIGDRLGLEFGDGVPSTGAAPTPHPGGGNDALPPSGGGNDSSPPSAGGNNPSPPSNGGNDSSPPSGGEGGRGNPGSGGSEIPTPSTPIGGGGGGGGSGGSENPVDPAEYDALFASYGLKTKGDSLYAQRLGAVVKAAYVDLNNVSTQRLAPQSANVFNDLKYQSQAATAVADEEYAEGREGEGNSFLYIASLLAESAFDLATSDITQEIITSVGVGAIVRDAYEASTGRSIINGMPLSDAERSFAIIGLATGGVGSKLFKAFKVADRISGLTGMLKKIARKSGYTDEILEKTAKDARAIQESGEKAGYADVKKVGEKLWFNEDGTPKWPANNGFEGLVEFKQLPAGFEFDRYGDESGRFIADVGTPFEKRALPLSYKNLKVTKYRVVSAIDVQAGKSAPWFGFEGGGLQYLSDAKEGSIAQLIRAGKIVRID